MESLKVVARVWLSSVFGSCVTCRTLLGCSFTLFLMFREESMPQLLWKWWLVNA